MGFNKTRQTSQTSRERSMFDDGAWLFWEA